MPALNIPDWLPDKPKIKLDISFIYNYLNIQEQWKNKQVSTDLSRQTMRTDFTKMQRFWDVEYAMFSAGIKYFNTCSEYWLYKLESEYIKAEKEYLAK